MSINAHIINHTHWDREWFLTSIYTTQWVPTLIDKLEQLACHNSSFRYLLDGQTLIIEDLLALDPAYESRVRKLIKEGHLTIGPYYCQPDWQLTMGELHMRNLLYGANDVEAFGSQMKTGWLVDTFGHIAQSPQIHQLFGLASVFVWRGVPQLEPYFRWTGSDGSSLNAVDLFGGYRNLYGVTHAPDVAVRRLVSEVGKLRPFYPTPDIPLFDGYDLEDDPEDSLGFFATQAVPETINPIEATPASFIEAVWPQLNDLPTIQGELNSGKFGATFPGTFSARTYLKLMAYDCTSLLFRLCEPVAAMAHLGKRPFPAEKYNQLSRLLLQNAVHDCICGVSIDMVHEKMEDIYRRVFDSCHTDIQESLPSLMGQFAAGTYAVSTNPMGDEGFIRSGDTLLKVKTEGVGVWPVVETIPVEQPNRTVETFSFNDLTVANDGTLKWGDAQLGALVVRADHGDTYSDEAGETLGALQPTTPLQIIATSAHHAVLSYEAAFVSEAVSITARVEISLVDGEIPQWTIDLNSTGTNFQVDFVCETAVFGKIKAGMPFDCVERQPIDTDLLPRDLEDAQAKIFMGQRELNEVRSFPFHEFVGINGKTKSVAVLAKGINAYQANENGQLRIVLRRSVEWLTKANLENRIGDAGPFFYVPDARCERTTQHQLGVWFGETAVDSQSFMQVNQAFHNPPLIVSTSGAGEETSWSLLQEPLPLSSLQLLNGQLVLRSYNPTNEPIRLSRAHQTVDPFGNEQESLREVAPKQIVSLVVDAVETAVAPPAPVQWQNAQQWRVGKNNSRPDPVILAELQQKVDALTKEIKEITAKSDKDPNNYQHQWQSYAWQRERLEFLLSIVLNQLKIENGDKVPHDYLYAPHPAIVDIGGQLNKLRIKRRIFDYVIAAL